VDTVLVPLAPLKGTHMSFLSRLKNGFINSITGKDPVLPIVTHPTTPIESALNMVASVALPAAAALAPAGTAVTVETASAVVNDLSHPASQAVTNNLATTIGTEAKTAVDSFVTDKVGNVGDELTDASLFALASKAITAMPSSSNLVETDVEDALHEFLTGLTGAK
jgi:hypothetical protein